MSDRPVEAIAEFDNVLKSDPGHLLARYQRALQIHYSNPKEALDVYASLIEHPRFEEMFAEQPDAIRAYHYVATDHLKKGRIPQALEVARRSLAQVNQSRPLRDEATHARRKPGASGSFSATGETYYLMARIHAADAAANRGRIELVGDCLDRAFAIDPGFRIWFAKDERFNAFRDELSIRLGLGVIDR